MLNTTPPFSSTYWLFSWKLHTLSRTTWIPAIDIFLREFDTTTDSSRDGHQNQEKVISLFPGTFFVLTWDLNNNQVFPLQGLKLWDIIAVGDQVFWCVEKANQQWEKMEATSRELQIERNQNKRWSSLIPSVTSSTCSRCKLSCKPVLPIAFYSTCLAFHEPINPFCLN